MIIFYCIAVICLTAIAVLYINYKTYELNIRTYNANVQGWMLVKGDHICDRLAKYSKSVRFHNNLIAAQDFLRFVNECQAITRDELVYRPYKEVQYGKTNSKPNNKATYGSKRNYKQRITKKDRIKPL